MSPLCHVELPMHVCGPPVISAQHKLRQLSEHPGFERAGSFNSRDRVHRAHLNYRVFLQLKTPLHKVLGGVLSLRI